MAQSINEAFAPVANNHSEKLSKKTNPSIISRKDKRLPDPSFRPPPTTQVSSMPANEASASVLAEPEALINIGFTTLKEKRLRLRKPNALFAKNVFRPIYRVIPFPEDNRPNGLKEAFEPLLT